MFYPKHNGNTWFPKAGHMGFRNDFVVPKTAANLPRFSMLVVGMFCSIAISAIYSFSLITAKLQDDFHMNQNDITTISTVGIVIGYLTLPFGFLYDYIGPKPIFAIGIICNVIGTSLFALTFNETIGHSVGGLSIINAVLNLGSAMYDMGSVLTVLSWFPLDRGLVIACMKTMTGLGSSVVATLYGTYFNGDNAVYMYFLLAWSVFIGLVSIVIFHLPPFHMTGWRIKHYTEDERIRAAAYMSLYMREKAPIKRYIIAFVLVISMLILLCTRSVVFVFIADPTMGQMNPPAIIMIVLYIALLLVLTPLRWLDVQPSWYDTKNRAANERAEWEAREAEERGARGNTAEPLDGEEDEIAAQKKANQLDADPDSPAEGAAATGNTAGQTADGSSSNNNNNNNGEDEEPKTCCQRFKAVFRGKAVPQVPEPRNREEALTSLALATEIEKIAPQFQTGFFRNCCRPTLIAMWVTGLCVSGVVNVVMMNSTQIYVAIGEDPSDKQRPALYVALTSIGSAVGRLVMAFTEVGISNVPAERRVPITVFYMVPPALCLLSCLFFLFLPAAALLLPMLFAGLGNGFYAACEVLTCRTIFSLDISKHYNSLFLAEMMGVIFMNRLLFGEIMTKNSTTFPNGSVYCIGRKQCVQTIFIVLLVLGAVSVLSSAVIFISYWRFAKNEIKKRRELRRHLEQKLAEFSGEQMPEDDSAPNGDI